MILTAVFLSISKVLLIVDGNLSGAIVDYAFTDLATIHRCHHYVASATRLFILISVRVGDVACTLRDSIYVAEDLSLADLKDVRLVYETGRTHATASLNCTTTGLLGGDRVMEQFLFITALS